MTKENFIHIEFKDFILGQGLFQPRGQNDFLDLAFYRSAAIKQKVLHHLLGDGRRTARVFTARADRLKPSRHHARDIIAFVGEKMLVFRRNEREFHQIWNIFYWHKQAAFLGKFVNHPAFAGINPADGGGGVLRQTFMAGQAFGIHPEDTPHGDRPEQQPKGDGRKDGPKE